MCVMCVCVVYVHVCTCTEMYAHACEHLWIYATCVQVSSVTRIQAIGYPETPITKSYELSYMGTEN